MIGRRLSWYVRRALLRLFAERYVLTLSFGGQNANGVGEIRLDRYARPHRITRVVKPNDTASWPVLHLYGMPLDRDDWGDLVWTRVAVVACLLCAALLFGNALWSRLS